MPARQGILIEKPGSVRAVHHRSIQKTRLSGFKPREAGFLVSACTGGLAGRLALKQIWDRLPHIPPPKLALFSLILRFLSLSPRTGQGAVPKAESLVVSRGDGRMVCKV